MRFAMQRVDNVSGQYIPELLVFGGGGEGLGGATGEEALGGFGESRGAQSSSQSRWCLRSSASILKNQLE